MSLDQVLKDLEFMKKINWQCAKREEYETIVEENKFNRFELMDFE